MKKLSVKEVDSTKQTIKKILKTAWYRGKSDMRLKDLETELMALLSTTVQEAREMIEKLETREVLFDAGGSNHRVEVIKKDDVVKLLTSPTGEKVEPLREQGECDGFGNYHKDGNLSCERCFKPQPEKEEYELRKLSAGYSVKIYKTGELTLCKGSDEWSDPVRAMSHLTKRIKEKG